MLKLPLAKKAKSGRTQTGQALLIVLLTMSVILSVVLSAVSRSVTEVSVTSYEENATRAFSAAEAGVEQALLTGQGSGGSQELDPSTKYATTVSSPASGSEFRYLPDLISGQSATFWFVSHNDATGALTCGFSKPCLQANKINRVCWGVPGTPTSDLTPAIELSIFYDTSQGAVSSGNYSTVKVARMAFDPNSSRRLNNNFSSISAGCTVGSTSYPYAFSTGEITFEGGGAVIPIPSVCLNADGCLLAAKVRMFYNAATPQPVFISVNRTGGSSLPAQGTQIDSTGTAGESTRRVNVFQSYPEAPFDVAVSSLRNLEK